ncbi:MAG: putative polymerase, sigma subunit, subfamily [Pseudonocardia sp.]|nr:putative polymerase, sigma subunit, subfamily [Pseudonocardia sp.]
MHDEAPSAKDTDRAQILGLYELLAALAPGPMVTLNRIVAAAVVHYLRRRAAAL